jgi:hypothetical protein
VTVPSSTIAHPLHMSPYIINNISHLCTILSIKIKKQTHLFIEPEATWQEEFDHAITILKESLKDYGQYVRYNTICFYRFGSPSCSKRIG